MLLKVTTYSTSIIFKRCVLFWFSMSQFVSTKSITLLLMAPRADERKSTANSWGWTCFTITFQKVKSNKCISRGNEATNLRYHLLTSVEVGKYLCLFYKIFRLSSLPTHLCFARATLKNLVLPKLVQETRKKIKLILLYNILKSKSKLGPGVTWSTFSTSGLSTTNCV